jgi:hypothetical protein
VPAPSAPAPALARPETGRADAAERPGPPSNQASFQHLFEADPSDAPPARAASLVPGVPSVAGGGIGALHRAVLDPSHAPTRFQRDFEQVGSRARLGS